MPEAVGVWDFDEDRLVFLKVVPDDEVDELADRLADKFYHQPPHPKSEKEEEWEEILWVDDERYEIIQVALNEGEGLEEAVKLRSGWKESVQKHGMPPSTL